MPLLLCNYQGTGKISYFNVCFWYIELRKKIIGKREKLDKHFPLGHTLEKHQGLKTLKQKPYIATCLGRQQGGKAKIYHLDIRFFAFHDQNAPTNTKGTYMWETRGAHKMAQLPVSIPKG